MFVHRNELLKNSAIAALQLFNVSNNSYLTYFWKYLVSVRLNIETGRVNRVICSCLGCRADTFTGWHFAL